MRTLVVATEYPWPRNSGSRLRLSNTIEGLSRCGPVELFSAVSGARNDFDPPPKRPVLERVERIAIDDRPPSPRDIARRILQPSVPFELPLRGRGVMSSALRDFVTGSYDLVWFFQVRAWVLAGASAPAHDVIDIDDLEDQKILTRSSLPRRDDEPRGLLRRQAGRLWTREDIRRWRRLHRLAAETATATLVCSELDARRSGLTGVRVIPNGYPTPDRPVGHNGVSSPPVVVFQGTLRYPPNADAARYLVEDIGPRLRALLPDVQIRLVGLAPPALAVLDDRPSVTVTGQVPDITAELSRADVIVIPLRYASGTRVKILEAFAHRIPVVSTTVGAEGLEVRPGTHLLVADDAAGIAEACARLLSDDALRRAVVDQAHALFMARYESSIIQGEIAALARELAGP